MYMYMYVGPSHQPVFPPFHSPTTDSESSDTEECSKWCICSSTALYMYSNMSSFFVICSMHICISCVMRMVYLN